MGWMGGGGGNGGLFSFFGGGGGWKDVSNIKQTNLIKGKHLST